MEYGDWTRYKVLDLKVDTTDVLVVEIDVTIDKLVVDDDTTDNLIVNKIDTIKVLVAVNDTTDNQIVVKVGVIDELNVDKDDSID